MSRTTGHYSIIQYCPDPSRLEVANVGVVLFCAERDYLGALTSTSNDRIRRFFGTKDFDRERLNLFKMSIQSRLEIDRDQFRELADLEKFAATRANSMQLSIFRTVALEGEPEQLLRQLFDRLVGGRTKTGLAPIRNALDDAFRAESIAPLVRRNVSVTLPVFQRPITAPYAFQNGRFNLIRTTRFRGQAPTAILERAGKYALEGELLYNAPDATLGKLQVVVVGQFAASQTEVAKTVGQLLATNHTKLYRMDQIDELIDEIRTTGKVSAG